MKLKHVRFQRQFLLLTAAFLTLGLSGTAWGRV